MKTQNLEQAGPLLVPVDETGTATGRPEASLSPMERGRAEKVLLVQVLYRGRPMSRRDVVRLAVSEGATPGNSEGPTLDWPDGRFLRMPKLAVDYARHLVAKGGAL